jgi:hypothetical protein
MVMIYRLTPIDPRHESWRRSKVIDQYIRLWAHNCSEARIKAAKATEKLFLDAHTPRPLWLEPQKSPWELTEVTSCEEDPGEPAPVNDVVTQDGTILPIGVKTP